MNKKIAVLMMLMISATTTSFAFDLGSAIGGFNSVKADSKSKNESYVEWFRNKIDRNGEIFITQSTIKDRVQERFEKALKISGLTPGTTEQFTLPLELKVDTTTFYEVWSFSMFDNKNMKNMLSHRYFIFCDKNLVGTTAMIAYDWNEDGTRAIKFTLLDVSAFTTKDTQGGYMGNIHKKTCGSQTTQATTPASSASSPEATSPKP